MTTLQAAIFDMDGLLVDTEQLAAEAMDAFLARYGLKRRQEIHERMLGRRIIEAMEMIQLGYKLDDPIEELAIVYAEMRREALVGKVKAMPGAREAVAYAREIGLRVGLASSGIRDHVELSLREAGLDGMFTIEVTGDDVNRGKPAPDLFLLAAERLGVEQGRCAVFEDAPAGVEAAVAAGMRAVCVPNEKSRELAFPVRPEIVLPSLHEAIGWLERNTLTETAAK